MRIWFITAMLLLAVAPLHQSNIKLEIGAKLKKKDIPKDSTNLYMTHPAQLRPYIERNINGVDYVIAYDRESRRIKYIATHDEEFKTADGLKIGSDVEVSEGQVIAYPGWEVRGQATKDGWYPVVGFDGGMMVLAEAGNMPMRVAELRPGRKIKVKIISFSKGGN
jgi:hypothetical protein